MVLNTDEPFKYKLPIPPEKVNTKFFQAPSAILIPELLVAEACQS